MATNMATMIVIRPGKSAKSICRLCFTEQDQCQSIAPLKKWIKKLTSLIITDVRNAPYSICFGCKTTLEDYDAFREMCLTNDRVFKETFMPENEIQADSEHIHSEPEAEIDGITTGKRRSKKDEATPMMRIRRRLPERCERSGKFMKATTSGASQSNVSKPDQSGDLMTCEKCGKHFIKRKKYAAHLRMHRKTYVCEYCDKGFPNTYMLKVHTRVHTGEKPFPCDQCDKGFYSRFYLTQHKMIIHELKEFRCSFCQTVFKSFAVFKRHVVQKICTAGSFAS